MPMDVQKKLYSLYTTKKISNIMTKSQFPGGANALVAMGVRRGGKTGIYFPLNIGTKNQNFLNC